MHKFIIFSAFIFSCTSVPSRQIQSDAEITAVVDSILTNWHRAASQADYSKYMNSMDSTSVFIGTDITENWTKDEFEVFAKPYFKRGAAWDFEPLKRNIYISQCKNAVWFDEVLNTWMGACRGSGVLERSGDKWKIKHYVLSIAVPNDDTQEVIRAKHKNDSMFFDSYGIADKIPAQFKTNQ
jgi:hypothetical protein